MAVREHMFVISIFLTNQFQQNIGLESLARMGIVASLSLGESSEGDDSPRWSDGCRLEVRADRCLDIRGLTGCHMLDCWCDRATSTWRSSYGQ